MTEILYWENPSDTASLFSSTYWNDIEQERTKDWWIESPEEIHKIQTFLESSGLLREFETACTQFQPFIRGKVLDAASGVCWTSALLSKIPAVEEVDALEFSLHRLENISQAVITGMRAEEHKIRLIFGSFYNIKAENHYDLVMMSQAFHHADDPKKLLRQIDKALKPGGLILMTGEKAMGRFPFIKAMIKTLVKTRQLTTDPQILFPPDKTSGDHYYRRQDYRRLFGQLGYVLSFGPTDCPDILGARKPLS